MNSSMKIMKTERTSSPQGRRETLRILFVILGVGLLTPWTYWQIRFFFSDLSPLQYVSNGPDIIAGIVVPLWMACFFPALGLGLGFYAFTYRLSRDTPLSVTRSVKVYRTMTDTQTYVMLLTAICLFLVNYSLSPWLIIKSSIVKMVRLRVRFPLTITTLPSTKYQAQFGPGVCIPYGL